ncbi:SCP-like extracellular protein [Ophiocordyceps camponoti-floridani]|uniref:SCP-like extracellular protein n=1 Tax=Ophiocordyceps camponoti-floridani TaxID=2030778 RepID=A0A8H4QB57_9HYPO|nr:SCP-like extracellular protein [Ophiocordyceps camponoti-floridani]
MKSSLILAATGALLVSASPVPDMEKRRVTHTVTQWVYATDVSTAVVTLAPGQEQPAESNDESPQADFGDDDNGYQPPPSQAPAPVPAPSPAPAPIPLPSPSLPIEPKETLKSILKPQATGSPKQSAKSSYPDTGATDEYSKAMLEKHNEARREHSVPALKWDAELASVALESARNCIDNHDNAGKTCHGEGFGQNLAWLWSSGGGDKSSTDVALGGVKGWYDEKDKFAGLYGVDDPYTNPGSSGGFHSFGHYTQMVWKDTGAVGCATHQCTGGNIQWVTVCNYQKAGNVLGHFAENVPRPSY